jgi:DNA-binding NarL/FixJ family response regulator
MPQAVQWVSRSSLGLRCATLEEQPVEMRMDMKSAWDAKEEEYLDDASLKRLTDRQRQILGLISIGHTNREIALLLKISVRTVEVHRFHMMRNLNVRNVAQLFRRALQLGLLSSREMHSQHPDPGIAMLFQFPRRKRRQKAVSAHTGHSIKESKL